MAPTGHTTLKPDISCHKYLLVYFLNFSYQYLSTTKCHTGIQFPYSKFFIYTFLICTLGLSILRVFTKKVHTANKIDGAADRFLYAKLWLIKQTGQAVHLPTHACTMEFYSPTEMVKVDQWFHRFPVVKK